MDDRHTDDISIDIRGLSVCAANADGSAGKSILPGLTLQVRRGRRAVLYGSSGSGKTTALRAVMGLVEPEAGEIFIEGRRLDAHSVWELRRLMAYVPQEPDMGDGRVGELLRLPFGYRTHPDLRWDEAAQAALFSEFHLHGELLGQDFTSLSGGEKQRVALVSALLLERPILLLDEITSALDRESKKAVVAYLAARGDLTIFAASHDPVFRTLADEVIRMEASCHASRPQGEDIGA